MSAAAARRSKGRSQQPLDDTEEVRNLRAKYSDRLEMIRELFPTWTDEDLLFALQDAGGDVELAIVRISEGQVEQFSSVKSKKQIKKETTSIPSLNGTGYHSVSSSTPASFARGRGGHVASDRGGRGRGGAALRGARGGRGGFRGAVGGRGGGIAPQVNGHSAKSPETIEETPAQSFAPIATPTTGTSWADALSKKNKQAAAPAAAASSGPVAAPALDKADAPSLAEPVVQTEKEAASTIPAAETATTVESVPAVKVPAAAAPAAKPGMSWAQIARKSEAPKPAPVAPAAEPVVAAAEEKTEVPAVNEEVKEAVEQASWTVDEPKVEEAAKDEPAAPAAPTEEVAAAPVEQEVSEEATSVAPAAETVAEPAVEQHAAPAAAPAPAAVAAPPGIAAGKPAQRAPASQRANQRSRQDAAVVMPGGSSQLDNLGVQFGSLNFLGGEDEPAEEATVEEPVAEKVDQPAPAPAAPESSASKAQPSLHERLGQSQATPAAQQSASIQDPYAQQQQQQQSYGGFKSDAFDSSAYNFAGQQQPATNQHSASQETAHAQQQQPQQQQQQDHLAGYGGFNSLGQNQSQAGQHNLASQQPQQQGLQDYSVYGGLDTQRLAHFYGGYDQSSNSFGQRSDDKASNQPGSQNQQQQQPQQPQQPQQSLDHQSGGQQQQHLQQQQPGQAAAPSVHHQQQQQQQQVPQQQFPGIMPYYYPHYYMPNQFQHYGQPTAGYGQYPVYGQPAAQPQHPSKPGTPANIASPYSQAGPQSTDASAYGAQSHYGQTPSSGGLSNSYDAQGFSRGMQGMPGLGGASDYSKIYGGAIPGLGGFLGGGASGAAPPSQTSMGGASAGAGGASGTPHLGSQQKAGAASGSALDSYRQFDASAGKASGQGAAAGQVNRSQAQGQSTPQQQAAQQHQQQQQQQYYHQYGAYGHQAHSSGSYGNYPYARQYWGQ